MNGVKHGLSEWKHWKGNLFSVLLMFPDINIEGLKKTSMKQLPLAIRVMYINNFNDDMKKYHTVIVRYNFMLIN